MTHMPSLSHDHGDAPRKSAPGHRVSEAGITQRTSLYGGRMSDFGSAPRTSVPGHRVSEAGIPHRASLYGGRTSALGMAPRTSSPGTALRLSPSLRDRNTSQRMTPAGRTSASGNADTGPDADPPTTVVKRRALSRAIVEVQVPAKPMDAWERRFGDPFAAASTSRPKPRPQSKSTKVRFGDLHGMRGSEGGDGCTSMPIMGHGATTPAPDGARPMRSSAPLAMMGRGTALQRALAEQVRLQQQQQQQGVPQHSLPASLVPAYHSPSGAMTCTVTSGEITPMTVAYPTEEDTYMSEVEGAVVTLVSQAQEVRTCLADCFAVYNPVLVYMSMCTQ